MPEKLIDRVDILYLRVYHGCIVESIHYRGPQVLIPNIFQPINARLVARNTEEPNPRNDEDEDEKSSGRLKSIQGLIDRGDDVTS